MAFKGKHHDAEKTPNVALNRSAVICGFVFQFSVPRLVTSKLGVMDFAFLQRFRFLIFGFAIVCFVMLAGAVYQFQRTTADLTAFPPPGRMISVNGVNLHLFCMGSGFPTLILEAGLGENSLSWHPVQSKLAQSMRVCSYDRPGLGWSDLINAPIHVEDVAKNLHTLLKNAGISPPYVLVGHSRGGIYVRAFYRQFPAETRGIVLVDSTHEQSPMHQYPYAVWDYWKQAMQIAIAEPLSRVGLVRLIGLADADRIPSPLPAEVLVAKTAVQNRSDTARAVVNEIAVMRLGLSPTTPPPTDLGNLPLLVLTAGNLVDQSLVEREAEKSGKNIETEKALARIQQTEQDDLARLSSNSRHIIIKHSGHFIMQDRAEEFVSAVSEFVKPIAVKLEGERPTIYSTGLRNKGALSDQFKR
ncbi:alpha/beta fold hydrolase [Methylomonas sp. MK1]|uniref:alpha/beta fold hydrolase n=1 Tax=Methylomonas sp. MK1 TaxID=1131552 RepID=UPI00037FC987|nr:alpha/beta hydrolase [Methylomonas sp. MK1]